MQTQPFPSGNRTPVADRIIRSAVSVLDEIVLNAPQHGASSQHESHVDARFFGTHIAEAVRVLKGQDG
jgi:hypothetical protein